MVSLLNLRELLTAISACLRRVMPHDFAGLSLYDPGIQQLRVHTFHFPTNQNILDAGIPSLPITSVRVARSNTQEDYTCVSLQQDRTFSLSRRDP